MRTIKDFVSENFVAFRMLRAYCACYGLTGAYQAVDNALRYAAGVPFTDGFTRSDLPDERYFQDIAANAVYRLIDEYGIVSGCAPALSSHFSIRQFIKELVSIL